ncbi:MAG: hypothetical protein ABI315_11320 [Bacteroidia bacterium]
MKHLFYFIFISIFLISSIQCKKEKRDDIPYTAVNLFIYTDDPSYIALSTIGGWVYVSGGVRGLIVYRKSNSEFMAYERNCTYKPNEPCSTIMVNNTNIIAVDTCCKSQFSIYDGSVLKGPATWPLKAYNTTYEGNVLRIYN